MRTMRNLRDTSLTVEDSHSSATLPEKARAEYGDREIARDEYPVKQRGERWQT
jgi:hypothetical protein